MPSIIEQIQRDALDPNVSVSDLLRRVKLAATKLRLGTIEDWVEQELSGYDGVPVPDYRVLNGRPKIKNPYQGWQDIGGPMGPFSRMPCGLSVAALEELANHRDNQIVHHPYPDEFAAELTKSFGVPGWPVGLHIDRAAIVSVLDRVRNLVLDWALKMEKAGVLGTEFSFSDDDRRKAQGATTQINIGAIGSFAGNLGVGNIAGDIAASASNVSLIGDIAKQLKEHIADLEKAGADGPTLKARLDQIEEELRKPHPTSSVLRGLLSDVRNAIAGAAGNLIATGATALLNQILGTGVPTPP